MASASMTQVLAAARQWLKPLVHVLVRCGVTWKDFAELAKTAYVEVATEQFGKRGRPTNVSRTAVLTGLARRERRKRGPATLPRHRWYSPPGTRTRGFWIPTGCPRCSRWRVMAPHSPHCCASAERVMCGQRLFSRSCAQPGRYGKHRMDAWRH